MPALSSYVQYLPVALWNGAGDPTRLLARALRVPEKILTGIEIDTVVARPTASIGSASGTLVRVGSDSEASRFRVGDVITVDGTAERQTIVHISDNELRLDGNLTGNYLAGTLRNADLRVGDRTFRVADDSAIGPGTLLAIDQGAAHDDAEVAEVRGGFVTLAVGLANGYSLTSTAATTLVRERVAVVHVAKTTHEHEDFERVIDELHSVFNPWRTRKDFLPWLASWAALDLKPEPQWTEYQRRELISRIVPIYVQRGLKLGLHTYLDIWAFHPTRPRITIDDGDALFHARPADGRTYTLHSMGQSQTVSPPSTPNTTVTAMLHPTGVAFDGSNNCFVCDEGDPGITPIARPPAVWMLSPIGDGRFAVSGGRSMPTPIASGQALMNPVAVVVDSTDRCSVLCIGQFATALSVDSRIYRFAPPNYAIETVIDPTNVNFTVIHPVDMTLDAAGRFVVLDRGEHLFGSPPSGGSNPAIYVVTKPAGAATVTAPYALAGIVEPTAILAEPGGTFLVADAGDQSTATPAQIYRVDLTAAWITPPVGLLPTTAAANPLAFPTGMVFESAQTLLVSDSGMRWGYGAGDPAYRWLADDAALYRVELPQNPAVNPAVITKVTSGRQLVMPTRVAVDRAGAVVVTDRGETIEGSNQRSWRAGQSEFGVSVLFSQQHPTTGDERQRIRNEVLGVMDLEHPAHTSWSFIVY